MKPLASFSTAGQNESGVAVHDDRIYVVGGYSIWTNEPLACIQVSGSDPKRPWRRRNLDILSTNLRSRAFSSSLGKFEAARTLDLQKKTPLNRIFSRWSDLHLACGRVFARIRGKHLKWLAH